MNVDDGSSPTGQDITDPFERAVEAVLDLMDGTIERASNRVYEWPEDEAAAYRNEDHRSLLDQNRAVSRLRAEKIVAVVERALDSAYASPLDFTPDALATAMSVPRRAPHVFPDGPTADLVDPTATRPPASTAGETPDA